MVEVAQDLQRVGENAVGFAALDVDDETDAAGIVLKPGIIQALLGRESRSAAVGGGGRGGFAAGLVGGPRVAHGENQREGRAEGGGGADCREVDTEGSGRIKGY